MKWLVLLALAYVASAQPSTRKRVAGLVIDRAYLNELTGRPMLEEYGSVENFASSLAENMTNYGFDTFLLTDFAENEPTNVQVFKDPFEFGGAVSRLVQQNASNDYDCKNLLYGALYNTLTHPNVTAINNRATTLFVMTRSASKDWILQDKLIALARQRQVQINFIIGTVKYLCGISSSSVNFDHYQKLANDSYNHGTVVQSTSVPAFKILEKYFVYRIDAQLQSVNQITLLNQTIDVRVFRDVQQFVVEIDQFQIEDNYHTVTVSDTAGVPYGAHDVVAGKVFYMLPNQDYGIWKIHPEFFKLQPGRPLQVSVYTQNYVSPTTK